MENKKFIPRDYQKPIVEAIEKNDFKRIMAIWPRRAGKDLTAWNICINELVKSPKTVYYVTPTFTAGRRILWNGITNDGIRFLDYLPKELIESKDDRRMCIELKNGSIFHVIGSTFDGKKPDSRAPEMVVFSEFSISLKEAYQLAESILEEKKGKILIVSTPYYKNHLYEMYNEAIENPDDWFVSKLTVDDTKHISLEDTMKERAAGVISEEEVQREYMTKFTDKPKSS